MLIQFLMKKTDPPRIAVEKNIPEIQIAVLDFQIIRVTE